MGGPIDPSGGRRGFDFRHFWHATVERIWILVACVLAGLLVAVGYLIKTPRLYQGHVVLEVEFAEPTFVNAEDTTMRVRSMFLASQEALRTIEQNLTNRSLMARVVRAEGLADDGGRALLGKSVIPPQKSGEASPSPTASPKIDILKAPVYTPLEEALGGAMVGMVKPVIRRGSRLIDLYVTNRDPAMAQRLVEAVGREYIRSAIERRSSFSQDSLRYLLEEEERLKANLKRSEAAVADYKEKTPDALQLGGGAAATGSQQGAGAGSGGMRGGLVEDKLQELNSKLTAAKSDRLRLEGELKQIEREGENVDALLAIPSIAAAQAVIARKQDLNQLEAAVAQLAQRYKDRHPKMMAARAAMAEARAALKRSVLDQPSILRNSIEQAKATETNLEGAFREQEKAALALNKAAIGYQELARQAETDRALYESVLRQIKETNLTKDVKTNAVSVVEHSPLVRTPVSPNPKKALLLGLLGGLAVGFGAIYVLDLLDRSIRTVDQAESTLGLPVLAAVTEVTKEEAPASTEAMPDAAGYRLMAEAPEGSAAEAFRNLRASLALLGPEAERKIFLFTSAVPNEGKSFTSANYALALAQQGYRVLLIDGDLRRPSLHKIFRSSISGNSAERNDVAGIVDCLLGAISLPQAIHTVAAGRLDGDAAEPATALSGQLSILSGGRRAPNPAELLSGPSFANLVAQAARLFDRVVIDSAPVLAVSDTLLLVPHVQTVCVVVRAGRTVRNAVQRALGMLAGAGGRPAGLVLNRLPRREGAGYYYYYANHGYGKGEGAYGSRYSGDNGDAVAGAAANGRFARIRKTLRRRLGYSTSARE